VHLGRALLGSMDWQVKAFTELASVLGARAGRLRNRIKSGSGVLTLSDEIDGKARRDINGILARIDHVLEARREWDVEAVAPFLNAEQRSAFFELMDAYDLYCNRLDIWAREFREAPEAHGALGRLLASTQVDMEPSLQRATQQFSGAMSSKAAGVG
jgi:hypothetical protein